MDRKQWIQAFWQEVILQHPHALKSYFTPDAHICWHNTKEQFTVDEYIIANCEYPGQWRGEIERFEESERCVITVARVWAADASASFHVTSFFEFCGDKISALNEYWGDDGVPPQWRIDKKIGISI